jgi:hypothetical protein
MNVAVIESSFDYHKLRRLEYNQERGSGIELASNMQLAKRLTIM